MVSVEDVRAAYRLILGREPENEEVLIYHSRQANSIDILREIFIQSPEFRSALGMQPAGSLEKSLDWPPIEVEVDASSLQLSLMMRHIEENWNHLGQSEPHWSVLTADAFRASDIERTKDFFYESGKTDAERLYRTADRCGISMTGFNHCFELGCGVGRTTIWLANLFERMVAADVSPAHLTLARQALHTYQRTNVELVHLNSFDSIDDVAQFDVFFSFIVLQHNPPPLIAYLITTILNKLKPGGIAYFQVPTYRQNYRFHVDEYLRNERQLDGMEMHLIPQQVLFEILHQTGCQVLECREDNFIREPGEVSNTIFARKNAV